MAFGVFGGGINSTMSKFDVRNSIDLQVTWELQHLGLGNRAAIRQRQAEREETVLRLIQVQDRIAAEVVQGHVRACRAAARMRIATQALREAQDTAEKSLEGLGQTRRAGGLLFLVVRPQEVVAAIAALDQGYRDYFSAVADYNRSQFELYRAIGHPAQALLGQVPDVPIAEEGKAAQR
jgi:outer membrane protein TolC